MKTYGLALGLGLLLAFANLQVLGHRPDVAASHLAMALLVGGPIGLALLIAIVIVATMPAAPSPVAQPTTATKGADTLEAPALSLLATLQEEGRLLDFFIEDITPYSDEQIGAATRGIHATCQKALNGMLTIEPILSGDEGTTVTVPAGFDPRAIRLVGSVSGSPPFTGVLRHAGWRVRSVRLPERTGVDPRVIAPAEVEVE